MSESLGVVSKIFGSAYKHDTFLYDLSKIHLPANCRAKPRRSTMNLPVRAFRCSHVRWVTFLAYANKIQGSQLKIFSNNFDIISDNFGIIPKQCGKWNGNCNWLDVTDRQIGVQRDEFDGPDSTWLSACPGTSSIIRTEGRTYKNGWLKNSRLHSLDTEQSKNSLSNVIARDDFQLSRNVGLAPYVAVKG